MNNVLQSLMLPELYPFVDELLKHGKPGISGGNIRVTDFQTGAFSLQKGPCADRFKLVIPFGGQSVTWEVLFFGNSGQHPPDFLFDDKTFSPDIKCINALQDWRSEDNKSLLRLINELLGLYREHLVNSIEEHPRLHFEYTTLLDQSEVLKEDVEVYIDKKIKNSPAKFLIRLPVDFSNIPVLSVQDNPSEDSAILLMTFQSHNENSYKVVPQLFLSPAVDEVLRGCRLPPFPNDGCLIDYVPLVTNYLHGRASLLVDGFQKRKDYFATFLKYYGNYLLEYDSVSFEKMIFHLEWKNFYFILHIEIPKLFPEDMPKLKFQSIYHLANEQPFTTTYTNYPYSPRWSATELLERTKAFILEIIPQFQTSSIQSVKDRT